MQKTDGDRASNTALIATGQAETTPDQIVLGERGDAKILVEP